MYKTLGLGGFIVTVVALLKGHAPSNGLHINYTIWYCSGHTHVMYRLLTALWRQFTHHIITDLKHTIQ